MEIINDQFSDLIRNKMSDEEFKEWVFSWLDLESICEMAEQWDTDTKAETLKEYANK